MHPRTVHEQVQQLAGQGLNDGAIARELGFARTTVRDMRKAAARNPGRELCWRCWQPTREVRLTPGEYAELLGFYLGDGHISQLARTQRLRLSLDTKHVEVACTAADLLTRGFPGNRVQVVEADDGRTTVVQVTSSHLVCLFPQHGPGKKHERAIVLEPWQREVVEAAPWSFLRGCLHSDGCFFINRTGPHRYLSAEFSNRSADILSIVAGVCDRLGLDYCRSAKGLRFYRRDTVTLLAAFVGAKW